MWSRSVVGVSILVAALLAACGSAPAPGTQPSTTTPTATPSASPSPTTAESPEPSPSPSPEPGAMPTSYARDVEPNEIPAEALIPDGASLTGQWFGFTDDGVVVAVAWVEDGTDFSRLPGGYAVWDRHASSPHWRLALVDRHDEADGIQEIQMSTTDVTGDGSDDALVFEGLGGSGACARWVVLDLLRGRATYRRELCDGRIEPGPPGEPGLVVTRSVFREGDAHCCPSAMQRTTLVWTGTRWRVTDRTVIEG
jgi:hypothetical protein